MLNNFAKFRCNFKRLSWLLMVLCLIDRINAQNSCTNPNGKAGLCTSIYDCSTLVDVIKKINYTPQELRFLRESQCGWDEKNSPRVCCTTDKNFIQPTPLVEPTTAKSITKTISPSNGKGAILPEPPGCGPDSLHSKIYSGNDTALDQFPWMVLLEYRNKNGQFAYLCGGSLINQRYVLTAAHCVKGKIEEEIGPLNRIRLGEYDVSTEIDCVDSDCNNKPLDLDYEEVIPHPDYVSDDRNRYHDIALIRLAEDVNYIDFIRPVCLPLPQTRQAIPTGSFLTVAGWGRTLLARQSNVKQQLDVPLYDQNRCTQKFSTRKIVVATTQLCAGGEFIHDSCDGDSGGPLMRKAHSKRWYLEGIVSFGNHCGLQDWPGVYTRVSEYIDWIQNNLKP